MLFARGERHIREAHLRWAIAFARRLWCAVVRREGLVLDTRYAPPVGEPVKETAVCLYLLIQGAITFRGREDVRRDGPAAFVVPYAHLERARDAHPVTLRAAGHPFVAVEMHFDAADLRVVAGTSPVDVTLAPGTWAAAEKVGMVSADDAAFAEDMAALIERVGASDVIRPDVGARLLEPHPRPYALLFRALRPLIESLSLAPTLQEVGDASGVSIRQTNRYVREFVTSFSLIGGGWRPTTRHFRLKLAVILLSAKGTTVTEVANAVGYLSTDAMARAFRDAGLPSPTAVQGRLARDAEVPTPRA